MATRPHLISYCSVTDSNVEKRYRLAGAPCPLCGVPLPSLGEEVIVDPESLPARPPADRSPGARDVAATPHVETSSDPSVLYLRSIALAVITLLISLTLGVLAGALISAGVVPVADRFGVEYEVTALGVIGILLGVAATATLVVGAFNAWSVYSDASRL